MKSPSPPGGQASPAGSVQQVIEEFLEKYGAVLFFVALVILLVALAAATEGGLALGLAALLVLIVGVIRKLLNGSSGPPTAATAALLKAGEDSVWSEFVTILSSMPGISPDTLRSLDLATPPAAGA
jgi:hypothetical protein